MSIKESVTKRLNEVGMDLDWDMSGDFWTTKLGDDNTIIVPERNYEDYLAWYGDDLTVCKMTEEQERVYHEIEDELIYRIENLCWRDEDEDLNEYENPSGRQNLQEQGVCS